MNTPVIIPVSFTYTRPQKKTSVLNFADLSVPQEFFAHQQTVVISPSGYAGNHRHERVEYFVSFGEGLEFFWLDEDKKVHSQRMNPNGDLKLFRVPSLLPHAVKNSSIIAPGILIEFACEPMDSAEFIEVLGSL